MLRCPHIQLTSEAVASRTFSGPPIDTHSTQTHRTWVLGKREEYTFYRKLHLPTGVGVGC